MSNEQKGPSDTVMGILWLGIAVAFFAAVIWLGSNKTSLGMSTPYYGRCNHCGMYWKESSWTLHAGGTCQKCGRGEIDLPPIGSDAWKEYKRGWGD